MIGGNEARRALRQRVDSEHALKIRRRMKPDAIDSPNDYADAADKFWPNVKKMERALFHATPETRAKAKAIIWRRHDRRIARQA